MRVPAKTVIRSDDFTITRVLTRSRIITEPKKSIFEDNGKLPFKMY